MDHNTIQQLNHQALLIRRSVLHSIAAAGSGHTGASLGLADIFATLYFNIMNHRPADPQWTDRDRLILSIGHVAPVLYASLAHAGYFPLDELMSLRKLGSRLQGHPGRDHGLPGIEISSGSLGQGLSVAVGMALAAKIDNKSHRIFCIHGDGELQEGSVWEAAMSAAHLKLDNIIALVDRNRLQIDGDTETVMSLEPLADKWRAFGWHVLLCNGNNIKELLQSFHDAKQWHGKPCVIIAQTIMGKGVKSIENQHQWHGKAPSQEQLPYFLHELEASL